MHINKNVKKDFRSVKKMLKVKTKSLLQILLNCTQIQNAEDRLEERCGAARYNEVEAMFCCFFDAYIC